MRGLAWVLAAVGLVLAVGLWQASPTRTRVLFEAESPYGRVRVLESGDGLRSLYTGAGRARQSAVYPGRPRHLESAYARVAMVGLALMPRDGRILFVGLGGGAMPMYVREVLPSARLEVVEIDPLIVEVAQSHFGVRPDSLLRIHVGDGRAFIEAAAPGRYDLIVLDAFSDDEIPAALTTRQFLEGVRRALAPGGVVVSNLWSSQRRYRSMVATYDAVFEEVTAIRVPGGTQRIVVAGDSRPLGREDLVRATRRLAADIDPGFDLPALMRGGE